MKKAYRGLTKIEIILTTLKIEKKQTQTEMA